MNIQEMTKHSPKSTSEHNLTNAAATGRVNSNAVTTLRLDRKEKGQMQLNPWPRSKNDNSIDRWNKHFDGRNENSSSSLNVTRIEIDHRGSQGRDVELGDDYQDKSKSRNVRQDVKTSIDKYNKKLNVLNINRNNQRSLIPVGSSSNVPDFNSYSSQHFKFDSMME